MRDGRRLGKATRRNALELILETRGLDLLNSLVVEHFIDAKRKLLYVHIITKKSPCVLAGFAGLFSSLRISLIRV